MTRPTILEDEHLASAWRWEVARASYLSRHGMTEQASNAEQLASIYLKRLERLGIGLEVQQ